MDLPPLEHLSAALSTPGRVRVRDVPPGPCVYLIHLHAPLKHARHYLGWSSNLRRRIYIHGRGLSDSCSFMRAVDAAAIKWRVVRIWWPGDRALERQFKDEAHVARLCPVCRAKALRAARDCMRRIRARPVVRVVGPVEQTFTEAPCL